MKHVFCLLGLILSLAVAPAASAAGQPPPPSQRELTPGRESGLQAGQPEPDFLAANIVPWARLVFQSYRDGNWEIYRANPDGTGVVRLTNNPSLDRDPRLNRGATRIVFASDRAGGDFDIFAMNPDGSGVTALTADSTDDLSPVWSADGTRIAFETYRHGISNGEVYVMNPNGSGQTRLTNSPGYDGLPTWSPDGSKIAFVSNRSGRYRIYVMNADGSGQQALSNQQNAYDPVWSPDGRQIAYDADDDGDDREELWLMNADGSNQHVIFNPSGDVVAWAHSWSPDGRYVAFSQIAVTVYQGNLYWTSGRVRVWDSANPGSVQDLTPGSLEWKPDLASVDAAAPSSAVQSLSVQSPGPFTVRWSGADTGGAGLKSYDVQVKDDVNGLWTTWLAATTATSAAYPGVGGHIYSFRSRARDNAFNVEAWPAGHDALTTVENLPPQTAVEALPEFSRNGVTVRWGGVDPGGSGIQSYDVQTRQDNGTWTNWTTNTTDTAATFNGVAGSTIQFRVRARDHAQNLEAWPGSADATTVLYTWGISGRATDNRGAPVVGMQTTTSPAAVHTVASDNDGRYSAHVAAQSGSYVATWSKASYGDLPPTTFPAAADASVAVVLPPADNILENGGFEEGNGGWQFSGGPMPVVTTDVFHSGGRAVRLGTLPTFAPPDRISQQDGQLGQLALGPDDRVHITWVEHNEIYYAQHSRSEGWSLPLNLSNSASAISWFPNLVVQPDGAASVVWSEDGQGVNFRRRSSNGVWSSSETIPGSPREYVTGLDMALDRTGVVHVTWSSAGSVSTDVFYSARNAAGVWSPQPHQFYTAEYSQSPQLVADGMGRVHLLWVERPTGDAHIRYAFRTPPGGWSNSRQVSTGSTLELRALADPAGGVHVAWASSTATGTHYMYFHSDGLSDSLEEISPPVGFFQEPALALEQSGALHVIWPTGNRVRHPGGFWGPVESLPISFGPWRFSASADSDGAVHLLGLVRSVSGTAVHYLRRDPVSNWSAPVDVSGEIGSDCLWGPSPAQPVVDSLGHVHMTWCDALPSPVQIMATGPALAQQADVSRLSQVLAVPANSPNLTLSFLYRLQGVDPTGENRLQVEVTQGSSTTVVLDARTPSSDWRHAWVDLSPWAGQTVTLAFVLHQASGEPFALAYLDDATVGSAHPDLWVQPGGGVNARPGQQIGLVLAHGNRGGVDAQNASVTLQLPAGLTFVSADPPPSATTPMLRWDVGNVPAFSQQTINLTLQIAPSAPYGSTLITTAGIVSDAAELETLNNTASGPIFVGSRSWLPFVVH